MKLSSVNETLFIPLLAKADMSSKNLFIKDSKAQEIISQIDYDFKQLKQSKWLSMFLSLRAFIMDDLVNNFLESHDNVSIVHLGCGLDSRCLRVNSSYKKFYDVDYKSVIDIRKEFYQVNNKYQMLGYSVSDFSWIKQIDKTDTILIVAEGLTMYLTDKELTDLLLSISKNFNNVHLIFDAYSKKGVRLSKIKNPVNKLGAKITYGFNKPEDFLKLNNDLEYINTHLIKKSDNELKGMTKFIFNCLYCGKVAQSIYKIYEFSLKGDL